MKKSVGSAVPWRFHVMKISVVNLAMSAALMACNTTPASQNPYTSNAPKPWRQTTNPQDVQPLMNGFLSSQTPIDALSGFGPIGLKKSNGEYDADDGSPITIGGQQYADGLGVHAVSTIKYKLSPSNKCTAFKAVVGLDDEIRLAQAQSSTKYGSVTFEVWVDEAKVWGSKLLTIAGSPTSETVNLPMTGKSTLELRVTSGADDANHQSWYDHADWADARVECATASNPPPATPPANPPTTPPPNPPATPPASPPSGPTTTVSYAGSDENFANPERGFYFQGQDGIDDGAASGARAAGESMTRLYFRIDNYRNQPIPESYLDVVRQAFVKARQTGLKIIPRFSYNFGPGGDAPKDIVLAHIDQLTPILRQNADVIAFLEAGFIGQWGEWHDSTNGLIGESDFVDSSGVNDASRAIADRLLAALPANRVVAIRYPRDKFALAGTRAAITADQAFNGAKQSRLGAYNDCFLASSGNWGTYINRDRERAFYNQDNLYVPQGGETCNAGGDAQPYIGCANSLDEMNYLHFSTLNDGYEINVLRGWENGGCMSEIKRRLGYRFRLIDATVSNTAQANSSFNLSFNVANDGFAAPYNPRGLSVVLRSVANGATHEVNITDGTSVPSNRALDPRFWTPGQTTAVNANLTVPNGLEAGNYEVLLSLYDPASTLRNNPSYAIQLANQNVWEASTGLNKLNLTLNIR